MQSSISHLPIQYNNMEKSISSNFEGTSNFFHKKRKQSDCESIGDNFDQEMSYLWTDERLVHLVTKFYDYVHSTDTMTFALATERHILVLHTLQKALLSLDDALGGPCPTPIEITGKLNKMANFYKKKYPGYYDLKEILGKHVCKKFRVLTRHERFDEYLERGSDSHRVSSIPSVEHSMCPGSGHYYWTDRRLQVLVNLYYMYLQDYKIDSRGEGTSEKNSGKCLAYVKKGLDGNVSIPLLRRQLNKKIYDYKEKSLAHEEFRTRIGKDMCALFDSLVNLDYSFYKNKDTTLSRSCGTSSRRKSSGMSKEARARMDKIFEAEKLNKELETYELNVQQIALVMLRLSDNEAKRTYFWACQGLTRKCFVDLLIREN